MENLPSPPESNPWLAEAGDSCDSLFGPRARLRHTDETDGIGLREAPIWKREKRREVMEKWDDYGFFAMEIQGGAPVR